MTCNYQSYAYSEIDKNCFPPNGDKNEKFLLVLFSNRVLKINI